MVRRIIGWWRCTSGTTAIEFALVAPIAILLCLSVLEIGRALYTRSELSYAVDLGARRVLLDPKIENEVLREVILQGLTASIRSQAIISTPDTVTPQDTHIFIEASVPFRFIVPIVPRGTFELVVGRRVPLM